MVFDISGLGEMFSGAGTVVETELEYVAHVLMTSRCRIRVMGKWFNRRPPGRPASPGSPERLRPGLLAARRRDSGQGASLFPGSRSSP